MNKEKTIFLISVVSALIILIIATIVNIVMSKNQDDFEYFTNRSIYNYKPSGYAAWYKVDTESKLKIKVWKNDFNGLININNPPATMIMVSPEFIASNRYVFTTIDQDNLLNWVRMGNTLVLVDDFRKKSSKRFLEKLNIQLATVVEENYENDFNEEDFKKDEKTYSKQKSIFNTPDMPSFNFKAAKISSSSNIRLKEDYLDPIIKDSKGVILAKRAYGKGTIYIFTLADLVDNNSLYEKEDNYQFFTNLATIGGHNIYVNEYIHGFIKADDALTYYKNTLLNPISKQLLLIVILLIWSVSRRFGIVRPLIEPDRKTNLEYVEAMANLYSSAGLTGSTLAPIYNQFRSLLCKNLKADINTTDDDLATLIRTSFSNKESEELITLIVDSQRVITSDNISKDDMLDLCRKLNNYRLKGKSYDTRS